MKRVQMVQINDSFDGHYYLPYSNGVLTEYALQSTSVKENFKFNDPIFYRESIDVITEKIGTVDVLGVSTYMWNWNISCAIGESVKKYNPECFIIYGGPQVPDDDDLFLEQHPFIDMTVHGEGEQSFLEILENLLVYSENPSGISSIMSTSYRNKSTNDETCRNPKRPRMKDLSKLPSPYLNDYFNEVMKKKPTAQWMAVWETNRGCPFKCTFCDWGSAIASKVVETDWDRLLGEIEWFARNKIDFIWAADANFGIRKRDSDIAKKLVESKKKCKYPKNFRVCFTKNSTEKIFEIAEIFHEGKMQKGVSLSMQSLHEPSLKAIERDNIKLETFELLQKKYLKAQIPTFTELILPLPEETYESFTNGIDKLLRSGQHSSIYVYPCAVMPNAKMGNSGYQNKYGIQMIHSPMFMMHCTKPPLDYIMEQEYIAVATNSMSVKDWKKSYQFAVSVQCFHSFGLLQMVAILLNGYADVSYKDFYQSLINTNEHFMKNEWNHFDQFLTKVLNERGFDQYMKDFGSISWGPEEIIFLRISNDILGFRDFVRNFLTNEYGDFFSSYAMLLEDVLLLQFNLIKHWSDSGDDVYIVLNYDIPELVRRIKFNLNLNKISMGNFPYRIEKCSFEDKEHFARYAVWHGRKDSRMIGKIKRTVQEKRWKK